MGGAIRFVVLPSLLPFQGRAANPASLASLCLRSPKHCKAHCFPYSSSPPQIYIALGVRRKADLSGERELKEGSLIPVQAHLPNQTLGTPPKVPHIPGQNGGLMGEDNLSHWAPPQKGTPHLSWELGPLPPPNFGTLPILVRGLLPPRFTPPCI